MPDSSSQAPLTLPDRPNLRHLRDQAKLLLRSGELSSLAEAQFRIAHLYGFASWPRLKAHIESLEEAGKLKHAIDTNDLPAVKRLMVARPALHRAPLGYQKNGPLTWVAECRVPWEPPSPTRLAMAQWMIDNGSDVHQGGDGPLMRAALVAHRIPMMELLLANGANVNAEWNGHFPIIFAPCEAVQPLALKWLLDHGADPNCGRQGSEGRDTALDYVIGTYSRSAQLGECIDLLLEAGTTTRRNIPAVLAILRGRLDLLIEQLDFDPSLSTRRFHNLDFGNSGCRRLTLRGGTLLHVAAEYGDVSAARLLLDRGADVNAAADLDEYGIGGQTPIFHPVSQFGDWGLPVTELLVRSGADLAVRVTLPGHYERPDEFVECTPLGYARLFPGSENNTLAFLRAIGAPP